ncbi:hypothetical protein JOQ06_019840 [Pogonophryne albipinna]|uniref:B box-type domain-containing protein n=1 Tax=Pogonophryne albipinna TaxID=1090488 RepID=A0AAD6FWE7_9TELE|nr:hypothetical protein JOQ06_019840 [Pogonophryne albipinna]
MSLDLDRYSSDKSRRSTSRNQSRTLAKSGEVVCDFCTTRKQKAEKSCLVCLASYCETHVQTHYDYPALMKHKLVKATGQMREKICAQHDKLLEAFCRTDETSVCVLCMMDEHKHHDIVPAGTERTEKQKQLGTTLHKSQTRIDQRAKKWQDLRQAVESVKHSAQTAMEENERIFSELLLSIERKYNEVKEMIRSHEKTTLTRAELLLDRLEEEITLLRKKHTDLEKLSHTDDHIHFLQSWQSLSGPSGYEDLNNICAAPNYSFDATKRAIAALKLQVEEVSKTEMRKISGADSCQLSLEVNSVHRNLHLSEGNRSATMKSEPKNYPDHPDRFEQWQQLQYISGQRYAMALYNQHVCPVDNWLYNQSCEEDLYLQSGPTLCCTLDNVPLISKCGTLPPESCFFSLICSTGSFMVMVIVLLRYAHVIEKHQNCVLNTASLSTGWICAAGLMMVGNFQSWEELYGKSQGEVSHQVWPCMERSRADRVCEAEALCNQSQASLTDITSLMVDNSKVLHYVGAGIAFPTSMLFVCVQSALTYRLAKTQGEYNVAHLRLCMTLLAFVALVLSGVFFCQESFVLQHASAIFEWLFCVIIMLFYGTFAFEFAGMSSDTMVVLARGTLGPAGREHKVDALGPLGGPLPHSHPHQPENMSIL